VMVQIFDIFIALPGVVLALIVTAMLGAKALLNLALAWASCRRLRFERMREARRR